MGRRLLLSFALIAFAVPGLLLRGQQQTPAATQTGTLRGTVTRQGTSEPLRDVAIIVSRGSGVATAAAALELALNNLALRGGTLADAVRQELLTTATLQAERGAGTNTTFSALTDSNGQFVVEGIPEGEYSVVAQREGFFGPSTNDIAPTIFRTMTTIQSQQTSQLALTMIPGGAVSGRVVGPNGMPAPNVAVQVLRMSYQNGARMLQLASQQQTDDRGEYRLYQLAPGDYYLAVSPRPTAVLAVGRGAAPVAAASDGPLQSIQVRTFYPNATDPANALPITVRPGDDSTGFNLTIQAPPGARVTGRVVASLPAADAIPNVAAAAVNRGNVATLTLLPRNQNDFQGAQQTPTTSVSLLAPTDGAFELPGVPAGSYDLYAAVGHPSGYGPAAPPGQAVQPVVYGRSPVDVRGGDVNGVPVVVHVGVDVKGQIIVDGKPAAAGVRISLQPADSSVGIAVYTQVGRSQIPIQPDGSFLIPAVPEALYRLQPTVLAANAIATLNAAPRGRGVALATNATAPPLPPALPATAYIADVRQGGVSVYDDGVYIGTNAVSPLEVLVNTNGGEIEGTVVGPGQQPVGAGTIVVLLPPVNRRQNFALMRTATTNAQGKFTMSALPPGPYRLFAWESIPAGAYQNAEFMKAYEDRGVSVIVQAGATMAQTVTSIAR